MTPVFTTFAVALLAYLLGRSTLPLLVGRCANSPPHVLQLELLLGNVLLSVIGLLLAECDGFTLPRVVWSSVLVCVGGLGVRRWQRLDPHPRPHGGGPAPRRPAAVGGVAWGLSCACH